MLQQTASRMLQHIVPLSASDFHHRKYAFEHIACGNEDIPRPDFAFGYAFGVYALFGEVAGGLSVEVDNPGRRFAPQRVDVALPDAQVYACGQGVSDCYGGGCDDAEKRKPAAPYKGTRPVAGAQQAEIGADWHKPQLAVVARPPRLVEEKAACQCAGHDEQRQAAVAVAAEFPCRECADTEQ